MISFKTTKCILEPCGICCSTSETNPANKHFFLKKLKSKASLQNFHGVVDIDFEENVIMKMPKGQNTKFSIKHLTLKTMTFWAKISF